VLSTLYSRDSSNIEKTVVFKSGLSRIGETLWQDMDPAHGA
jgi:hypothetical protein